MKGSSSTILLATASYDHTIKFWEAHTGKALRSIPYADSQVNCLSVTSDAFYLAVGGNPHVRVFEVEGSGQAPVSSYDGHTGNVTQIGFQHEGKWMYSASEDTTVKLWDLRASGCQREFDCSAAVNTAVLHPNEVELVCGDQHGSIRVWDLRTNTCSRELVPAGDVAIQSISVSTNGSRIVAANNEGTCFVWRLPGDDTARFDPLTKISAHKTYITKCAISPDGERLATCSADHSVLIYDMGSFKLQHRLQGHQQWVWDCAWAPDSTFLVSASSDHHARLWNTQKEETIRLYKGHTKTVSAVVLLEIQG